MRDIMPLKIIKKGDGEAKQIRRFSFSQDANGTNPEDREHSQWWAGADFASTSQTGAKFPQGKPAAMDPAQIEKTAFENGFSQGEKAGLEIAEKKLELMMQRYAEAISEIDRLKSTLYSRVERDVVKLALAVSRKIVRREIEADPEIVQTLIKVALSHAAVKSAVTIRLHPIDYNYILEHRTGLPSDDHEGREIVLLADQSIERGGCLIQTECGDIDGRIEEQFREVERSFFPGQD